MSYYKLLKEIKQLLINYLIKNNSLIDINKVKNVNIMNSDIVNSIPKDLVIYKFLCKIAYYISLPEKKESYTFYKNLIKILIIAEKLKIYSIPEHYKNYTITSIVNYNSICLK